jgi:(2R)-sulfolactate sulfo-lyase subunit alpha
MAHKFLVHRAADHVGVAVVDIAPGEVADGVAMDTDAVQSVTSRGDVPLGHKIALVDLTANVPVIEYGAQIGLTRAPIQAGDHVHTHNIKTARW